MNHPTIKQLVREQAKFVKYEDGKLWYQIIWSDENSRLHLWDFPIPVDDAGGGAFLPTDKALTFMRWIRKHLDFLKAAQADAVCESCGDAVPEGLKCDRRLCK